MQISRHWRLNAERYRLEGTQYEWDELFTDLKGIEWIITYTTQGLSERDIPSNAEYANKKELTRRRKNDTNNLDVKDSAAD